MAVEKLFANDGAVLKAGRGNEFHIHLDMLAGVIHLFIRLGDVLGVGRLDSSHALFTQEAVEPRYRAGVAALHELHPEYDQTGIRVTPAHIGDEFDLLRCMLVGMMMRASGKIPEGLDRVVYNNKKRELHHLLKTAQELQNEEVIKRIWAELEKLGDFRLVPVVTIILNFSKTKWNKAKSLKGLVPVSHSQKGFDITEITERMQDYQEKFLMSYI